MGTIIGKLATGAAAAVLLIDLAVAQSAPEVQVQAKRAVTTSTGRIANGVPVMDITVSYGVSAKDIDLSTSSGAKELEQRVNDAAAAACKEISRQLASGSPSEAECIANASGKAMGKVREMVAAAQKNTAPK